MYDILPEAKHVENVCTLATESRINNDQRIGTSQKL